MAITIVPDIHGTHTYKTLFEQTIKTLKPDIVVMEMLPEGPFKNNERSKRIAKRFGEYYFDIAMTLNNEKYTVVGLEMPKHRPAPDNEPWTNLRARLKNIEKDWAQTVDKVIDDIGTANIIAWVGKLHVDKFKRALDNELPSIKLETYDPLS